MLIDIKTWKNGDTVALHKPLLLLYLLGKTINKTVFSFSFLDIEDDVNNIYKSFGISPNVHYPFWRLRNDGILIFGKENQIKVTSAGDAILKDLREFGTASWSHNIMKHITKKAILAEEINDLLYSFFPESLHLDILDKTGLYSLHYRDPNYKKRDPSFRQNVSNAYNHQCAVCQFNMAIDGSFVINEAAHIKWHANNGPDSINNGILLCPLHHKAFDLGLFTVNSHLEINLSTKISAIGVSSNDFIFKYKKQKIQTPLDIKNHPKEEFLFWHQKNIFKG